MPSMVFISHSSKDRATADAICAHLESAGINCWIEIDFTGGTGGSELRGIPRSKREPLDRRLSLARLVELRLNAVCAVHFQIVDEMDASLFNPVAG
jgi:hypothetical protein